MFVQFFDVGDPNSDRFKKFQKNLLRKLWKTQARIAFYGKYHIYLYGKKALVFVFSRNSEYIIRNQKNPHNFRNLKPVILQPLTIVQWFIPDLTMTMAQNHWDDWQLVSHGLLSFISKFWGTTLPQHLGVWPSQLISHFLRALRAVAATAPYQVHMAFRNLIFIIL